jgi:hypothetical protein
MEHLLSIKTVSFGDQEQAASVGGGAATDSAVDALLARASAKLEQTGEEDRTEIIDLIESIRDARRSGDRLCPGGCAQPAAGPTFLS